jgi:phosphate transport system substrate-binding protein
MNKVIRTLVLGLALIWPAHGQAAEMLQIKGSDTLINLVQKLAEEYMTENPGAQIAVTGGGSGTGIAALINKKCDIANSSRQMKSKEVDAALKNGVEVKRVIIAIDGLGVITNPRNPVTRLSVDEIGAIFRGEITNWKDIGGNDGPITLYGRQSNSGTFAFFQDSVLKADYSQKMNHMNGNAQIVEAVKQDVSGIGYVGVGYVKDAEGLTVLKVAAKSGGDYASPLNAMDVKSGKYPLARPLNQYVSGSVQGDVKKFLEYELSSRGQQIVEEEGFFPISSEYKDYNKKAGL